MTPLHRLMVFPLNGEVKPIRFTSFHRRDSFGLNCFFEGFALHRCLDVEGERGLLEILIGGWGRTWPFFCLVSPLLLPTHTSSTTTTTLRGSTEILCYLQPFFFVPWMHRDKGRQFYCEMPLSFILLPRAEKVLMSVSGFFENQFKRSRRQGDSKIYLPFSPYSGITFSLAAMRTMFGGDNHKTDGEEIYPLNSVLC